jgi:sporulation protein YlmC with PRC-barrel domain
MRVDLDTSVTCVDGAVGALADVVIDPAGWRLTHIVVAPHDHDDRPRLVPIEGVRSDDADSVALDCTIATLAQSDPIQESAYLRMGELVAGGTDWSVGIQEMFSLPEYGSLGPEIMGTGMTMEYDQHVAVSYHRIPPGEVEIRGSSPVTSSDGHHLGHVAGFVIDPEQRITQLILGHGHLWAKRKVAVPAAVIERCENDALTLSLTADEIGKLEPLSDHQRSR